MAVVQRRAIWSRCTDGCVRRMPDTQHTQHIPRISSELASSGRQCGAESRAIVIRKSCFPPPSFAEAQACALIDCHMQLEQIPTQWQSKEDEQCALHRAIEQQGVSMPSVTAKPLQSAHCSASLLLLQRCEGSVSALSHANSRSTCRSRIAEGGFTPAATILICISQEDGFQLILHHAWLACLHDLQHTSIDFFAFSDLLKEICVCGALW